ncbi:MAG: MotA/TolQ/ExbB proton channel family protein [Pirellulales bacterium]
MTRSRTSALATVAVLVGCILVHVPPTAAQDAPISIPEPTVDSSAAQPAADVEAVAQENPIPTQSLWDMTLAGGPLLIPILACSFVLLLVVFERAVSLRPGRIIPRPFVKRFMHQLREGQLTRDQAATLCAENPSDVARVFSAAVRKWGRPAVEVEQAILDEGERAANNLRRYLRVINGVATVSPLLGLLGTVWGMMEAFNAIATAEAMGRPEMLAAGISQALLTTAAGLFVAIPALIFYLLFVGRVDRLVMNLDAAGQELVNLISAEGLQETRSTKTTRKEKAA